MNDPHIPKGRAGYLWHHPTRGWTALRPRPRRWHGPHPIVWVFVAGPLLWWGIIAVFQLIAR